MLTKLYAIAFAAVAGCSAPAAPETQTASAITAPICRPACDACHVCFQLQSPPGGPLVAPACIPKSPKPIGCP